MVILPSPFCVDMFTWLLCCCHCDQFLLWYEVAVKICQRAAGGTSLSCLQVRGVFSSKHVKFCFLAFSFFNRCLEISIRPQDVFGMLLMCWHISFYAIFVFKQINRATYWMNGCSVTNKAFKATAGSFFVICSQFTDFYFIFFFCMLLLMEGA